MLNPETFQDAITPAEAVDRLLKKGIHISERTLRKRARQTGAYRKIGRAMFFLPSDINKLAEPEKCLKSYKGKTAHIGLRGGPSTATELKSRQNALPKQKPDGQSSKSQPDIRPIRLVQKG